MTTEEEKIERAKAAQKYIASPKVREQNNARATARNPNANRVEVEVPDTPTLKIKVVQKTQFFKELNKVFEVPNTPINRMLIREGYIQVVPTDTPPDEHKFRSWSRR